MVQMLAVSTEKVNDPGETAVVPGTEEFKINNHPVQGGAFRTADTLELTSWKITFSVTSFYFAQIRASRNPRGLFFDIRYPLKERFYHEM
jgi:hypothetical protein